MAIFKVNSLTKKYGERLIFDAIDINISKNGFYVLAGKNGSGKSTFFKILKGIETSDSGTLEYYSNENELRNIQDNVSYCPANPTLFDSLSALENVKIITNDNYSIDYYFTQFELNHLRDKKAKKLSAGEKIRVCIIRTILENKPIILFDEITKHLDRRLRNIVLNELCLLSKKRIILYTTHYNSDIPENVDGIMKFDSSRLTYDSETGVNDITLNESKINYKILNKILDWKLNYLFLLIILMFITVISVSLTYLTEDEYKSLYRHSLGENSYVLGYNGRQIISKNVIGSNFENIGSDNFFVSNNVNNLFDSSSLESFNDVFNCSINRFNIIDKYDGIELNDNQIIVTDFIYHSLQYNGLIFNEENHEYFKFCDQLIEIVDYYDTSFSEFVYMFELDDFSSKGLDSLKDSREESLKKLLEDYKFYFDYTYVYNQAYCNYNTFKRLVYSKRLDILNGFYLDDIEKDENFSYELVAGRMPEKSNEVVLTKQLFMQLIKNKYYIFDKKMSEYLNEEFEYIIKSNNGQNEQIISFTVVGYTSDIIEEFDLFDEIKQRTLYMGIIDYDGSISNEILSWEGYFITDKSIGFTNDITEQFAKEIYDKGYIFINNNTLSLLDSYKIRDQFSSLISTIIISLSILFIIIMLLSSVLEYRFIKTNVSVINYLSVNKKMVRKIYLNKNIFALCVYSILLFISCIFASDLVSSYCSELWNLKVLLFDTNYLLVIAMILVFVILKVMEKKILFSIQIGVVKND